MGVDCSAASAYINHGSAASLDDRDPISVLWWVFILEFVANSGFFSKGGNWQFFNKSNPDCFRSYATTGARAIGTAGESVLNRWLFFIWLNNGGSAPTLWIGDQVAPPKQVVYTTQDISAGAINIDAANDLRVGSRHNPDNESNAIHGPAFIYERRLSPQEALQHWDDPRYYNPAIKLHGIVLRTLYRDKEHLHDYSPYGNHGTLSGAPTTAHRPWRLPRRRAA